MQSFIGKVISSKTPQTVVVQFSYFQKHPKYQKILKKTTKLLVHNKLAGVAEGDTVRIVKSRPYSKNKHFLLTEVVTKSVVENKTEVTKPEVKETAKPKVGSRKAGSAKSDQHQLKSKGK